MFQYKAKFFTRFVYKTVITSTKQSRWHWFMLRPRQRWDIKQRWRLSFARLKQMTRSWSIPFWNANRDTQVNRETKSAQEYILISVHKEQCWQHYKKTQICRYYSVVQKNHTVLHTMNFEPFTTESHCLHQNAWQRLLSTNQCKISKKVKVKAFPYSIPSAGPGADPGVQAVSLHVTVSHTPSGRLPVLSARPAVTSPATEHHCPLAGTKLYCLVTEANRCEQLA